MLIMSTNFITYWPQDPQQSYVAFWRMAFWRMAFRREASLEPDKLV